MHIPVMVGVDEQGPFRNKNGLLSQTVLVACSFDLKFHYVLAGWEGSASDFQVLNSALTRRNKLPVPEGMLLPFQLRLFKINDENISISRNISTLVLWKFQKKY